MALFNLSKLALNPMTRGITQRFFHASSVQNGFFKKPAPTLEVMNTGYSKIEMEAAKVGEDPFESFDRDQYAQLKGSGTKNDPYLVPTRNNARVVCTELNDDRGAPPAFWVTKEEGGRCPITGKHFKLDIEEGDKWGIDELDLFSHH